MGEPFVSGAEIEVRDAQLVLVAEWTTLVDGTFAFVDLEPGGYRVSETDPPGFGSTTPGEVVILVHANAASEVFFGDVRLPTATATASPTATPTSAELILYLPMLLWHASS